MQQAIESAGIYALLAFVWVVVPAYVIRKLWRRRFPSKYGRAEPVESNLPRVHRKPVTEIEAKYGRDYRGPGRKGEPIFSQGGVMVLVMLAVSIVLSMWLRGYIEPIADWLVPAGRSSR